MPKRTYEFSPEEIKELLAKALGFEEKDLKIEFKVESRFDCRDEPMGSFFTKAVVTEK